jgi:hypothetical protein
MRALDKLMRRVALAAIVVAPATAAAQLPNASAAAHAMGGNFTALARGYEAVAWNAANLAMPGRPFFSIGLGIVGGSAGLDPVDFRALSEWSGEVVPAATRSEWLEQARLSGGQHARLDGGLTPLAFSLGPVGFQYGASTFANVSLSPDAWEAMLFGNAGNNGDQPKVLDLSGTSIRVGATSAAAMSFAFPIPINLTNGALPGERAAVGITAKYVMGHGLAIAQDAGSVVGTSDVTINFPMIVPDSNFSGSLGNGVGADLSLAWSGGPWRVGALAENVFNTFAWDTTVLASVTGVGMFSADSNSADFGTELPFGAAPAALRELVTSQKFMPAITIGAAFKVTNALTVTADLKTSTGGDEAIVIGPKSRVGVGAEWRVLSFLPLRAGFASVTDGWQAGAGVGLRLLGYELGLSTSIRRRGAANESGFMLGLVGIGR